jgi:DNA-binding transcriptional MerR regulator
MREATIAETARESGLTPHTLRYYERVGLLGPVHRAESGQRRYADSDREFLAFLTILRRSGMPIRRMQAFVSLVRQGDSSHADRAEMLERHRADLDAQIERLMKCRTVLDGKIAFYRGLLSLSSASETETGD